jgi:hypothetical protein
MATQKERRAAPRKPVARAGARSAPKAAERNVETQPVSNEDLYNLIAEIAYFKAKARGFAPGGEVQDWIEAEAEVRTRMRAGAP